MKTPREKSHASPGRKPAPRFLCVFFSFLFFLLSAPLAVPVGQISSPYQLGREHNRSAFGDTDSVDPVTAARRLRYLNEERQKSMVSDTEKLLKLTQELNAEIAASDQTALTPIQVRRAAEIEKLARNVKQKMVISFADGPGSRDPLGISNQ